MQSDLPLRNAITARNDTRSSRTRVQTPPPYGRHHRDIYAMLDARRTPRGYACDLPRVVIPVRAGEAPPCRRLVVPCAGELRGDCLHFNCHPEAVEPRHGWHKAPLGDIACPVEEGYHAPEYVRLIIIPAPLDKGPVDLGQPSEWQAELKTRGRIAHRSVLFRGDSAIRQMAPLLQEITTVQAPSPVTKRTEVPRPPWPIATFPRRNGSRQRSNGRARANRTAWSAPDPMITGVATRSCSSKSGILQGPGKSDLTHRPAEGALT